MICPVCHHAPIVGAVPQPCAACWRTLTPEARAPFLRTLRAHGGPYAHRDPTRHAPPTLAAYVAHLEAQISHKESADV